MASHRVDQYALTALGSRVDKVKDLVCDFVLRVKKDLVLLIDPVECQVSDADAFPHVAHRVSRAVHNVGHFIGHDELQILFSTNSYLFDLK